MVEQARDRVEVTDAVAVACPCSQAQSIELQNLDQSTIDLWHMRRALELAVQGQGAVEPNPMAGCIIARGAEIIGEGWHRRFGGPHAEVEALKIAGERARGATMYVTLEPCCHYGKTPPCTGAILAAGIARVVVAMTDPFPQVSGGGLAELRAAGVELQTGVLEEDARKLNAPYLKLLSTGRPWIIAKWAMTLDGKIATASGDSRWISCRASRQVTHQLRGRMDAIVVGRGTAEADDPLLTARPPGPRTATRIVVDTRRSLSLESQLVRTAREAPVLVAVGAESATADREQLRETGCEVFLCAGENSQSRLESLLNELGRRRMTNVLVEGGSRLLGSLFDARLIDEVHVFIAPKLAGGEAALSPVAGSGVPEIAAALALDDIAIRQIDNDIYLQGRVRH
jgi:diaminohydroxyphosphoribosylaminopyrimidine deaminase/5-amino-6-(5-phosphoribosylamino)uracil reductase